MSRFISNLLSGPDEFLGDHFGDIVVNVSESISSFMGSKINVIAEKIEKQNKSSDDSDDSMKAVMMKKDHFIKLERLRQKNIDKYKKLLKIAESFNEMEKNGVNKVLLDKYLISETSTFSSYPSR
jgi:hypothetical protein